MNQSLNLRIILKKPPPGIDFGLQKGSGSNYITVLKQRSASGDLIFDFSITLASTKDSMPKLSGPYVQGPPDKRFVYIDIGTYAGQTDSVWGRRLKVPLTGITAEKTNQLLTDPSMVLETVVPGTGKDGGPNCATVNPFFGWQLKSRAH